MESSSPLYAVVAEDGHEAEPVTILCHQNSEEHGDTSMNRLAIYEQADTAKEQEELIEEVYGRECKVVEVKMTPLTSAE